MKNSLHGVDVANSFGLLKKTKERICGSNNENVMHGVTESELEDGEIAKVDALLVKAFTVSSVDGRTMETERQGLRDVVILEVAVRELKLLMEGVKKEIQETKYMKLGWMKAHFMPMCNYSMPVLLYAVKNKKLVI